MTWAENVKKNDILISHGIKYEDLLRKVWRVRKISYMTTIFSNSTGQVVLQRSHNNTFWKFHGMLSYLGMSGHSFQIKMLMHNSSKIS